MSPSSGFFFMKFLYRLYVTNTEDGSCYNKYVKRNLKAVERISFGSHFQ